MIEKSSKDSIVHFAFRTKMKTPNKKASALFLPLGDHEQTVQKLKKLTLWDLVPDAVLSEEYIEYITIILGPLKVSKKKIQDDKTADVPLSGRKEKLREKKSFQIQLQVLGKVVFHTLEKTLAPSNKKLGDSSPTEALKVMIEKYPDLIFRPFIGIIEKEKKKKCSPKLEFPSVYLQRNSGVLSDLEIPVEYNCMVVKPISQKGILDIMHKSNHSFVPNNLFYEPLLTIIKGRITTKVWISEFDARTRENKNDVSAALRSYLEGQYENAEIELCSISNMKQVGGCTSVERNVDLATLDKNRLRNIMSSSQSLRIKLGGEKSIRKHSFNSL